MKGGVRYKQPRRPGCAPGEALNGLWSATTKSWSCVKVNMRKVMRDAAPRQSSAEVTALNPKPGELDPVVKAWLDNVIIPILLKKLRQEWNEEHAA
jgi:hypothetical protein